MIVLSFIVPGVPVAKGRPRLTTRGGFARAYTPAKTRRYEDLVRCEAIDAMNGREPLQEPVCVTITAYLEMPKRLSSAKRIDACAGIIKPVGRMDVDNIAKSAIDGCNAIVFKDDNLVTDLIVRKRYSETPRLVVTVETEAEYG